MNVVNDSVTWSSNDIWLRGQLQATVTLTLLQQRRWHLPNFEMWTGLLFLFCWLQIYENNKIECYHRQRNIFQAYVCPQLCNMIDLKIISRFSFPYLKWELPSTLSYWVQLLYPFFQQHYTNIKLDMSPQLNSTYTWTLLPEAGPRFNIKMSSYQYRKSHCGDKTILRPSYLHNGISYTGKTSLYWFSPQVSQAGMTAGCNYPSLPEIPASSNKVLIYIFRYPNAVWHIRQALHRVINYPCIIITSSHAKW